LRRILLTAALVLSGLTTNLVSAASIPYANPGYEAPTVNLVGTGTDVIAYFAGSQAAFSEQIGMYVNGELSSAGFVFPNHDTANGFSVNLGYAAAGAQIVFGLQVFDFIKGQNPTGLDSTPNLHYTGSPSYTIFSAPSSAGVNSGGAYLLANADGVNHAYITDYVAGQFNEIPLNGTYVAFEDLFTNGGSGFPSDLNYRDEQFVFTGVAPGVVPEPSSVVLLGIGVTALLGYTRKRLTQA
jgi:hypothetical protein